MRCSHRRALIVGLAALAGLGVAGGATAPDALFARTSPVSGEVVSGIPAAGRPPRSGTAPPSVARRAGPGEPSTPAGFEAIGLRREGRVRRARVGAAEEGTSGTRGDALPGLGDAGVHWIGVFDAPDQPLVSAGGLDLSAPRDLTLWKLDEERTHATPVTRLRSEPGRPFLAENLLLSAHGATLVAAPTGADPFGPEASTIIEVPPRDLSRREDSP